MGIHNTINLNSTEKYKDIEIIFFNKILDYFNDSLIFYCVTGSTARLQNINKWSDIDIIMVFNKLSKNSLEFINSCVNENSFGIKIGVTCYSRYDIENRLIDPKTSNMIRNIKYGKYHPRINSLDIINILNLTDSDVLNLNRVEFSKDMHLLRRELMKGIDSEERKIYKLLTYMIRVFLFYSGYIVDGYFEIWDKVAELEWENRKHILFPDDIIHNRISITDRYKIYNLWYEFLHTKIDILNKKDNS